MEEEKKQAPFKSGEKGFAVFLLLFGLFFLYQSILLYQEYPGASSCASIPLFVSALIVIFSVAIIITDRKAPSENHGLPVGEIVKKTLGYMVPKDVLIMMAFILLYCVALYMGLGFYIATPIFLWGGMSYLMAKDYVKNILWTALCMAFILVVFRLIFSVVLP
ncbi:MAG: tripartite tricarboxylate transporter TctB family protein [Lachnospiraceae bacterium]|nr:tripartite tricarboxylate transporter TctB family protein [Lachnospiraceae bacterium]